MPNAHVGMPPPPNAAGLYGAAPSMPHAQPGGGFPSGNLSFGVSILILLVNPCNGIMGLLLII